MATKTTQTNATRNQSTASFTEKRICIWNNRFVEGTFKNTSGGSLTLVPGMLVARHATLADTFIPVTSSNLANIIGIAVQEGDVVLADAATVSINIVVAGGIDATQLTMPASVTLNTVDGGKAVKDILNGLGMHLDESAVEHTKLEN